MPQVPRTVLKEYFQTGDKPSAAQFGIFIDSTVNFVDDRDFIGLREYNPDASYLPGDCAVFNDQVVRCITATTGPYNPAHWTVLAAFGSVTYMGSWDAQNNVPFLQSSVGTQGFYYVVTNASPIPGDNTDLNGTSDWITGDWAIFNGTIWERVDYSQAPYAAQNVSFVPTVDITSTNVQSAIEEVYNDLSTELDDKADKIIPAVTGNFAALAADGNLIDSTFSAADFQTALTLTPNFYPYANGTTLADGVISNETDGVALTVGKVFRSASLDKARVDFGALGDEIRLTTDGSTASESRILMSPPQIRINAGAIALSTNDETSMLALGPAGDVVLVNDGGSGSDGALTIRPSQVSLYRTDYGGVFITEGGDSTGQTDVTGGGNTLTLTNAAVSLSNTTGGTVRVTNGSVGTDGSFNIETGEISMGYGTDSNLVMTPTDVTMNGPTISVGINDGTANMQLTSGQILLTSADAELELSFDEATLKKGTYGGIRTAPGFDSTGITFVSGGGSSLRLSNALTQLSNSVTGGAITLGTAADIQISGSSVQIDGNLNITSLAPLTVPVTSSSNILTSSSVTVTELGYVSGVTSAIQTQLNAKLPLTGGTLTGDLILNGDPSVALGAATKQYVDGLVGSGEKKSVVAFTFDQVYLTTSAVNVRIPLAISLPHAADIYTDTTTITARLYVDYRTTDFTTGGRIGLSEWDATTGLIGSPIIEESVPPTDTVWTKYMTGPFDLPSAQTLSLVMAIDVPGHQIEIEGATLILTYA